MNLSDKDKQLLEERGLLRDFYKDLNRKTAAYFGSTYDATPEGEKNIELEVCALYNVTHPEAA